MRLKSSTQKYKYEFLIFLVLLVQSIPALFRGPSEYYIAYLFDYKIGYVSRVLIGSLINLLTNNLTVAWLRTFITTVYILVFMLVALLLGKLIRHTNADKRRFLIFTIAYFLIAKYAMWVWFIYFGIFDIFWFSFAILAIIAVNNRYAKWFIPILCFLGLATHYAFAFIFMPTIAVVLLFDLIEKKYAKQNLILTVVSCATMAVTSVYFFIFANRTIKLQGDALVEYVYSKLDYRFSDFFKTYLVFYFDPKAQSLIETLKDLWAYVSANDLKYYLQIFYPSVPVLVLLICFWVKVVKLSTAKNEKRLYLFICTALPFAAMPAFLFSNDLYRLLSQFILSQFCLIFYLVYKKNNAVLSALQSIGMFLKRYPELIFILVGLSLSYSYKVPGYS